MRLLCSCCEPRHLNLPLHINDFKSLGTPLCEMTHESFIGNDAKTGCGISVDLVQQIRRKHAH